jgi:hypothetical protein
MHLRKGVGANAGPWRSWKSPAHLALDSWGSTWAVKEIQIPRARKLCAHASQARQVHCDPNVLRWSTVVRLCCVLPQQH